MTTLPDPICEAARHGRWALRGARVVDGTGRGAFTATVVIEGDTIVGVESRTDAVPDSVPAADVAGAVVCPGFIDVHSHADNAPLLAGDGTDTSKIEQGVTTEVTGNCGFSLAPHLGEHEQALERLAGRLFPPMEWNWSSFASYLAVLDDAGYVTNQAPLVGHHALRIAAMGMRDATPDDAELRTMCGLLEASMTAGAFGLSSGLIYPPGVFSTPAELAALAAVLPTTGVYATHMRGESVRLLDSLREAVEVAERSGRRVHVSHLKAAGRGQWGSMGAALAILDAARARGFDLGQDIYPYTAGSTMLTAALPPWCQEGGDAAVLQRLADPQMRARLHADMAVDDGSWENHVASAGWDGVVIASSASHRFDGRSLAAIAEGLGVVPTDALIEVLLTEQLQVSMIVHAMDEADLELALAHPCTVVGSDGLPPGTGGRPHPRTYGTFPRILARYVRERSVLDLETAIHRMTGLPAHRFHIPGRGIVSPGAVADLVVLDVGTVQDTATFAAPIARPAGVGTVIQAGVVTVNEGRWLGTRHGQRLRPAGTAP